MSQEQVLKTLIDLGLTRLDSQVYIYLAKKGPQKGQEISKGLKIQKQQLYRSLKNLQGKGIVESSLKHPAQFSAVSFDKVVDIFVKAKMAEANRIQENKEEILASWKALAVGETPDASAKFTIIEGRGPIYSRILQMVKETKNSLSSISTVTDLVRADQFGLFNAGISHPLKEKIKFRLLTETSKHDAKTLQRLIHEVSNQKINIEARTPGISLNLFSYIVIRDDEEIISVITPRNEQTVAQEEACLWTNCKPLVQTFLAVFENLWSNSQNVVEKTKELETETTAPETYTINNAQTASRKYEEILRFAQREIIMMTSPQGLNDLSTKTNLLRDLANRGVSIKVMSTIKSENLAASQQLLEYCNIKHVPNSYMNNTIVDGLHLFQFRNMPSNKQETDAFSMYENAFYTSDLSQIEKTKNILNDIWKKASSPSPVTLESLIGPYGSGPSPLAGTQWKKLGNNLIIEEKHGSVTEKDVLNKIINAKKLPVKDPSRDVNRMYASSATAIIHPPDYFNLPDMLIHIDHIEKQSSLGQGDALEVHLRSETSEGPVFIPMGGIGDNPKGVLFRKGNFRNHPAAQNYLLVKKTQLRVRVYGNTLFAAWTIPIPLVPPKYFLPPGCLIVEGYGEAKTKAYTAVFHSGVKYEAEQNWFDAFVTFMHPESKYSGPGTDGLFIRDLVATITPPPKDEKAIVEEKTQ